LTQPTRVKRIALLLLFVPAALFASTPLNDLGPAAYAWGYVGGLWDDGSNTIPADHLAAGMEQAALIRPLDENGQPSASGKVVLLVAGFGETRRMADAFAAMTATDRRVNHDSLVVANAAFDGIDATAWQLSTQPIYTTINHSVLLPAGVTEKQVQAAWIEMVENVPYHPLPPQDADAYRLKGYIAQALRAMKDRYPNLRVAYLSSRVYGGYATTNWNPEPFAYESGLSVRWIVTGQVNEVRGQEPYWDTRISDIDYRHGIVPWVTWGPYLWADGTNPRSDGLTWQRDDFEADGETLSDAGALKGARLLLDFLLHEPTAAWFRSGIVPERPRVVHH
jgi:hypothetical protein